MTPRGLPGLVASGFVLATLAAACGGGTRLTKPELISRGDAICKASQAKTDELAGQLPDTTTQETLPTIAGVFGQILPVLRDTSHALHALKPPKEDEAAIKTWLDDFDRSVDQVDALQKAAASGDPTAFNAALDQGTALGDQADADATAYGFTVCGAAR